MALDLQPSIRLHGIKHLIKHHGDKHHGDKHQGIKLINIKHLGFMLLGFRYLSISGLSNGLHLPSPLEGLRRWKRIITTMSHLYGCRI
jgi:hypothetical protein